MLAVSTYRSTSGERRFWPDNAPNGAGVSLLPYLSNDPNGAGVSLLPYLRRKPALDCQGHFLRYSLT